MNRRILLAATLLACAAFPALSAANQAGENKPIAVEGGIVLAVPGTDPSIMTYKSIPFAAPPVGNLRWRAPQPVVPWKGPHATDKYPPSCVQEIPTSNLP